MGTDAQGTLGLVAPSTQHMEVGPVGILPEEAPKGGRIPTAPSHRGLYSSGVFQWETAYLTTVACTEQEVGVLATLLGVMVVLPGKVRRDLLVTQCIVSAAESSVTVAELSSRSAPTHGASVMSRAPPRDILTKQQETGTS